MVVTTTPGVDVGGSGDWIGTVDTATTVVEATVVGENVEGDRVNSARVLSISLRSVFRLPVLNSVRHAVLEFAQDIPVT
jgi:hypothetical protein